jgi:hypothetical protein
MKRRYLERLLWILIAGEVGGARIRILHRGQLAIAAASPSASLTLGPRLRRQHLLSAYGLAIRESSSP